MRVGGQAVIEGVMIKSDNFVNVSVRKGKKIISQTEPLIHFRKKFFKIPFIRGIFQLVDMLRIGIKALIWSANQQIEEEEDFSNKEIVWIVFTSLFFGLLFFVAIPYAITTFLFKGTSYMFNLIEGLFRILIFFIYVFSISFMDDVKLLYAYHGAEHMAVNCYEAKKKLTVKNCRNYNTLHPRCGTSFVMIVLLISIVLFSFVKTDSHFIRVGIRFLFIPIIASISYEILRFTGKHHKSWFVYLIVSPGLLFQYITTKKPTDSQLEVAIHSLKEVLKKEKHL